MTLTIEAPEIERRVRQIAVQHGMPVETYVLELITKSLPLEESSSGEPAAAPARPFPERATPAQLKEALQRWAENYSTDAPLIPDEALRRENLYEDRGL